MEYKAVVRVLLVDPPFYRLIGFYNRYFPLGLVSVGTALAQAGHEVAVYDADCNDAPSVMDYKRLPEYYSDYLRSFDQPENAIWTEVRETINRRRPDAVGITVESFCLSMPTTARNPPLRTRCWRNSNG